ncbi:MAG: CAF17-like 4Fe-4S cluster assembly/insertion protein YgfZ [Methylovulum sp.]
MNQTWKSFLLTQQAVFEKDAQIVFPFVKQQSNEPICPVAHLAVLTVGGKDAAKLLQGQITCDINEITETKSSLGAICNPKGRAIAVFLLIKSADGFLLVLPAEQLDTIKNRLRMYVLRADVTLTDSSDELCLIGQWRVNKEAEPLFTTNRNDVIRINFSDRELIITEPEQAIALWSESTGKQGYQPSGSGLWRYFDILAGIPWLCSETAEEFIPQMLNLDKLGGISFTKGCYTGQEIVARTHYLGKAKRALFLAECTAESIPEPNADIIDDSSGSEQIAGHVVLAQSYQQTCKLLVVLQISDTGAYHLKLRDQTELTLLTLNI